MLLMIISLIIIVIIIIIMTIYIKNYVNEKYCLNEFQFAHFGGIPNQSQLWSNMVKYPKDFV